MGAPPPRVGWAVVNVDDGSVWARTTSLLGAFRRIAAGSDDPMTWRDVQNRRVAGDPIEVTMLGDRYRFEVVPASEVVEVERIP